MSKFFSAEEREQILAESRRLIEDGIDAEHEQSMYEPRGDERAEALAAALREPTESLNSRHRRELLEQDELWAQERRREERERERKREAAPAPVPAPVDWSVVNQLVCAAVAVERERVLDVLAHTIAHLRDEQAEAIERATEALRGELKVAIAKAAVAGDFVVRAADGGVDVLESMRKNRTLFRNAMRRAEAAASASEGMTIEGASIASDAMNFGAAKRSVN